MKKLKTIKSLLVKNTSSFAEVREADKIIAFLKDSGKKSSLPANLQTKLLRYNYIHGLRMRYQQRDYIIGCLKQFHNRNPRQAGHDIAEAEYIFGKAIRIDRQFELNFVKECSMKNIELAMATKNVKLITMALDFHHKACVGPEADESELPDATKFEQHVYNMILAPNQAELIDNLTSAGAIDLGKIIPTKLLNPPRK